MSDWDAIIIGGGPAGLTAGLYLCRGNWRTLLLEKDNVGGYIMNVETIENYPGFAEGVAGAQLAMDMKNQAVKYGLQLKRTAVNRIQVLSEKKYIACSDDTTLVARVVVVAAGSIHRKLNVPGEAEFQGRGVISCAFCDGGEFDGQAVAVFGGGDAGITEALYLTRIASKVFLIEAMPGLTGTAVLQDRVKIEPKIEVLCGKKATTILGTERVEAVQLYDINTNQTETLNVEGVLVHIGLDPNSGFLEGVVRLDNGRQVIVDEKMETSIPGIYAAGDIRTGSPRQVAGAVGDGAIAGIFATRYLQQIK